MSTGHIQTEVQNYVKNIVDHKMTDVADDIVQQLLTYINLEAKVINQELANNTVKHGYDFKSIPETLINSLHVVRSSTSDNTITYQIRLDDKEADQCSETLIDFFNEYVAENARRRYRYRG